MVLTKHLNGRQVHMLLNITLNDNHSIVMVRITIYKWKEKKTLQYINEKNTIAKLEHNWLNIQWKYENEKCLFSNTHVFYIVSTQHDLNRHQGLNI